MTENVAPGWEIGSVTSPIIRPKRIDEVKKLKGLKVAIHGKEDSFKTGSTMFFPPPIDIVDLELGSYDLADFHVGEDIRIWECMIMKEQDIGGKKVYDVDKVESLLLVEQSLGEALRSDSNTIVIDSVTELYDWAMEYMKREGVGLNKKQIMSSSIKKLTTRKDLSTFDFGISNSIMHDTIMKGLLSNKHFIVIGQDDQVWEENRPTDKYKPAWMKKIPYWMPNIVGMHKEINTLTKIEKYYAIVEKCRANAKLKGEKIHLLTINHATKEATIEGNLHKWFAEHGIGI